MDKDVLKIFLLEDAPMDQELIKRTLQKAFHNCVITIASSKEEFYEKLQWAQPDIILSDYNLPAFNGLEALLHVKENHPHIPFVFVTGMLQDEEKAAGAILKGAAGYLLKDNIRQLPDMMNQVLQKYQQHTQSREKEIQKERERQLLQQKLEALIESAEDFSDRDTVLALVKELRKK